MANLSDISRTYDWMDELFRMSLGDYADITCAWFDGNFSLSLPEAQKQKHDIVLEGIHFSPGDRILDIGSGWGPILKAVKQKGGIPVGLTLSPAQYNHCVKQGFEVYLKDWKEIAPDEIGKVDGIVSIGAFEHFCAIPEYLSGKQASIYSRFFEFCQQLLPPGGRLYLQTMTWGSKGVPDYQKMHQKQQKHSDYWHLHLLEYFYPGSWLPSGLEQIATCAQPYFRLVRSSDGRKDYIFTMQEWGRSFRHMTPRKILKLFRLLPKLWSHHFRKQMEAFFNNSNRECFKRNIMGHQRMFFEKVGY